MAKFEVLKLKTKVFVEVFGVHEEWHTVYQIRALKSFATLDGKVVKKGDLGGYIESPRNLSQHGRCWIEGNAYAVGNARISGDALISAVAEESRIIVFDSLCSGKSWIQGSSTMAWVEDGEYDTCIASETMVYDCVISGNVKLTGSNCIKYSRLEGFAKLDGLDFCSYGDFQYEYIENTIVNTYIGENAYVYSSYVNNCEVEKLAVVMCEHCDNLVITGDWRNQRKSRNY